MKKFISLFIVLILLFVTAYADDEFVSVYDGSGIISPAVEKYIYTQNQNLSEQTGARIVIATENSTGELSVPEYAQKIYSELGVGSIGRKNCVFLFLCDSAKDYHVIVSPGINASLTNQDAQKILSEYTEAYFEKGKYDKAVIETFNAFAMWFSEEYGISLELTDDMSEYDNIIRTEHNERTLKRTIIIASVTIAVIVLFGIISYIRREKKKEKLRKKRQERRKRYMAIK